MIYKLVHYSSVSAGLIPIVFLCKAKWTNLNLPLRILFIYVLVAFGIDLFTALAPSTARTPGIHNIFTIIEYFSVAAIYFNFEGDSKPVKLFGGLSLLFVFLYIIGLVIEQRFHVNNYIGSTAEAFVLAYFSIRYYFQFVDQLNIEITHHPYYWFTVAFMIYFSGVIFLFLFSKVILSPNEAAAAKSFWIIHSALNVIYNTFLAVGVYQWRKSQILRR